MGLFGSSKDKKELQKAKASLKSLDKRKSYKMATSTIDPTKALSEMQPWQVNQEKTTTTLSSLSHKDIWGNEIKEPDLSNPTRNRWERPLDTVRAFQESIDRGYRRSYYGGDADTQVGGAESSVGGNRLSNSHRYDGATDQHYPHSHRHGNTGTPISNNSVEDHGFGVGAMGSRNVLNDPLVMNGNGRPAPPRNHYPHSPNNGYADSTQDPNYPQYERAGPSYQSDGNYSTGPPLQQPFSPLQQQTSTPDQSVLSQQSTMQSQQSVPRTIQKLGGSAPTPTAVPQEPEKKQRKSWLGKRLSKKK